MAGVGASMLSLPMTIGCRNDYEPSKPTTKSRLLSSCRKPPDLKAPPARQGVISPPNKGLQKPPATNQTIAVTLHNPSARCFCGSVISSTYSVRCACGICVLHCLAGSVILFAGLVIFQGGRLDTSGPPAGGDPMAHSLRRLLTHSSHVFNNTESVSQYHMPVILDYPAAITPQHDRRTTRRGPSPCLSAMAALYGGHTEPGWGTSVPARCAQARARQR